MKAILRFLMCFMLVLTAGVLASSETSPVKAQIVPPLQSESTASETDKKILQPLLDVLKDDEARKRLIEKLESETGQIKPLERQKTDESRKTIADDLVEVTRGFQKETINVLQKFWFDLIGIRVLFTGDAPGKFFTFLTELWPLLVVALATFGTIFLARRVFLSMLEPVYRKLYDQGIVAGTILVFAYTLAYVASLALAYAVGNGINAGLPGDDRAAVIASLYLNAFVVFGVARIVLQLITGIVKGRYRLMQMPHSVEKYMRNRSLIIAGILIFGVGFLVPIINADVSFAVGRSIRVLLYSTAAIVAVIMIRQMSQMLRAHHAENEASGEQSNVVPNRLKTFLLWLWPWVAYSYVFYAYIVALTRSYLFAEFIGGATSKSLIALALGGLLMRLLGAASEKEVIAPNFLPLDTQALSSRLSSITPIFFKLTSIFIVLAILAFLLDAWSIFDVQSWVEISGGSAYVSGILSALIVFLIAGLLWAVIASWIDYRIKESDTGSISSARTRTLYALLRNAITIAIVVFGGMIVLSELGLDIGPLLAGAGVLGLAIGFGSQKLVQDIISGVFIQLENAMNVGDVVSVGVVTGVVERLTLRSVSLRDLEGVYHIVPFSSVEAVANYQRVFSYHVEEVGIAYKEQVTDGKEAMQEAFHRLLETEHKRDIIGPLEMHGVTALADSSVNIRARIKTRAGQQFALGRAYKELVKEVMDELNIEIPFPHTTMYLGRDKDGKADEFIVRNRAAKK